jgi:hypothetical protein
MGISVALAQRRILLYTSDHLSHNGSYVGFSEDAYPLPWADLCVERVSGGLAA